MIVRELLAVFGLQYDKKGQKDAEKGLQGLTKQADMLQTAFASIFQATIIAAPFVALTKLASDAQENLNLMALSFGESADDIVRWSDEVAGSMGRSRFTLREMAAEFGGLLQPMVGTGDQLAEMSKGLAQLAVDLSSARNIPEPESLRALQSSLAGNIIALKRFGVNLNLTRVQNEAVARGWSKNTQELTQAQLATIRYELIMKDLEFISGDAANTLDQFANSTRATRDALKDIGTELGFFLLPAFESALIAVRAILKPVAEMALQFREWTADTNLAKGALLGLVTVIGALLLPLLLKMAPLLLAFAAFALIMDDVITTFEGGTSILGTFTELLDDLEKGAEGVGGAIIRFMLWPLNRLRDVIGAVGLLYAEFWKANRTGNWSGLAKAAGAIGGSLLDSTAEFLQDQGGLLLQGNKELFGAARGLISGGGSISAPGAGGGGLGSQQVTFQQGNRSYSFEVFQQPGESAEDFTQRVAAIIDQKDEEKDQALANELVQGAVP